VRRRCGLPDQAAAVSYNLTVTAPTHAGDVRLYPSGARPFASAVNCAPGQTRANSGIVSLGPDGSIAMWVDQAAGSVDAILDVNGYFTTTDEVPTPVGLNVRVRPAPEVEITFDEVTQAGVTKALVVEFADNRVADVDQDLKSFFPPGSPLEALVPSVTVPSYLKALGKGSPGGPPTFVLAIVETTARFRRTAEFHGFEDFRLGYDPACVVPADRTREPRTFYVPETAKGEPALVEGAVFTDVSSGCGSNKGSGWSFSLYLTGRDTRPVIDGARFKLQRLQDALFAFASFITVPAVATSLGNDVQAALDVLDADPAAALAHMDNVATTVDANPGAFDNAARNVAGEVLGRAQSAAYLLGKTQANPPGTIDEFPLAANRLPRGIVQGPDGALWFTESDRIGRITTSGAITEFQGGGSPVLQPYLMTSGPDGNLWITALGNRVWRLTPTGTFTVFPVLAANANPHGITTGPDGNLWIAESFTNRIVRMTTAGVAIGFPVPTAGAQPEEIVAGPDGNLWFTERNAHKIGRITPAGVITEFPLPTAASVPTAITVGPDGNLWFTEYNADKIGRITLAGVVTEFPLPTRGSRPGGITATASHVWFTEQQGNRIGRITMAGVITEYGIPTAAASLAGITPGPDGRIWFLERGADKVGRIVP
jgi:streptogramin lyase